MIRQCLILAGGVGSRLGALTKQNPKPLLDVCGKPFLDRLIVHLGEQGIKQIVISTGYLAERIESHYKSNDFFNIDIKCVKEMSPAGTGGAIKVCQSFLDDIFYVTNGDTFFNFPLQDLNFAECEDQISLKMALHYEEDISRYGGVDLQNGFVVGFAEKGTNKEGLINSGTYVIKRDEILKHIDSFPCSLEHDLFPILIRKQAIKANRYDGIFIDIGVPEDYKRAQILFKETLNT